MDNKKFEFRRTLTQIFSLIAANSAVGNLATGNIYKGEGKYLCAPGLNCYSCPAATVSCPIGAMQAIGGAAGFNFSLYVFGFLLVIGLICGRFICGFLCPFGLFQEILHKIPSVKKKLPRWVKYVKYFILVVFVLGIPLFFKGEYAGSPAFCEFICPAGTLEGALPLLIARPEFRDSIGLLFALKFSVLVVVIIGSVFVYRFFCKTLCPLGAFYGLLNRISVYGLRLEKERCVSCGSCENACKMDINPIKTPNSAECIMCGKCATACPQNALRLSTNLR